MSRLLLLALLVAPSCTTPPPPRCLVFVGDVMLARGVAAERSRGVDVWSGIRDFRQDLWIGNLEGSVIPPGGHCDKDPRLCLGFSEEALDGLPFYAVSLANNHSHDYGEAGYAATQAALAARGVYALTEELSPQVLEIDGHKLAFVALNLIERSDTRAALEETRLRLGLARALAPTAVALPHWGMEYREEPEPVQARAAEILTRWGATLVFGAHAHVPQPAVCGEGLWYGLGNHVFDQLPDFTHTGLLVRCCPQNGAWSCTSYETHRGERDLVPQLGAALNSCTVPEPPPPDLRWQQHWVAERALSVQPLQSAGPGAFLALWRNPSSLDGEEGLRFHVFRADDSGVTDLWRGTALSRPTEAARVETIEGQEVLCALHRGDSFLHPDPATPERQTRAWRWNGFGFDSAPEVDCGEL